jgi:hypothetical protein
MVDYVLSQQVSIGILSWARTFVERYFPAVASMLVRLGLIAARTEAVRTPVSMGDGSPL